MMRRLVLASAAMSVFLAACSQAQETAKRVQDIGTRTKGAVNDIVEDGKHVQQAISGAVKMAKHGAALVGSGVQKLQQNGTGAQRGILW